MEQLIDRHTITQAGCMSPCRGFRQGLLLEMEMRIIDAYILAKSGLPGAEDPAAGVISTTPLEGRRS